MITRYIKLVDKNDLIDIKTRRKIIESRFLYHMMINNFLDTIHNQMMYDLVCIDWMGKICTCILHSYKNT